MIPFDEINQAVMADFPAFLAGMFPAGKRRGREFVVGNLNGDKGDSLSINMQTGAWADFAGGDRGGDGIALYAAARCNGDQKAAAIELGKRYGIYLNGFAKDYVSPAPRSAAPIEKPAEYTSSPPPAVAPRPRIPSGATVHEYRNAQGEIVSYVIRIEATETTPKQFRAISWGTWEGKTGWHWKHVSRPRPLYGLDRLAANPDAPVIVCEGEKAADAAQRLFPDHVAVTWPGGSNAVENADFSPLKNRDVIIWPDNDEAGHKAATQIAEILPQSQILPVDDLPAKADAADIHTDNPAAWLADRLARNLPPEYDGPDFAPVDEANIELLPPDMPPVDAPIEMPKTRVIPLGYDRGVFFYYSTATRQVAALKPADHNRTGLGAIASAAAFWEPNFQEFRSDKGFSYPALADHLMDACRRKGIYDPEIVRGRGAWLDAGRSVLHLGDRLIIDGQPAALDLQPSAYVYEAARSLRIKPSAPLDKIDGLKLRKITAALRWEAPVSGTLLAGWIAIAPICGALAWRPSIWLTGGRGSGKSWVADNIVRAALGPLALLVQSVTSEAGIRHELGCDARPVIFDEAEREDHASAVRMQQVLALMRQASSETGAKIVKGSATQTGAKHYQIRSAFMFQSINVGLQHQADESRVSVLALREPSPISTAEDNQKFADLKTWCAETLTPDFCGALVARMTRLIPTVRQSAEIFAQAIAATLGSRRLGDQLGTLLAGAYHLTADHPVTLEKAKEVVSREEFQDTSDVEDERDEMRCLRHILAARLKAERGAEYSVGRLIESCSASAFDTPHPSQPEADIMLKEAGLKIAALPSNTAERGLYVALDHPALRNALRDTPWSAKWSPTLLRLPGALGGRSVGPTKFGAGKSQRAIWIPLSTITGEAVTP